ncbi:MAG: CRISPR-associated endonuclease Cas2 [Candidatus Goldbacteria bacterium]|nr:CRISPR-associated endonuclease Cas2 [Candidatus Goldiibacteriota bacterium]
MSRKMWYLVSYDIRDPVRLRKSAKLLKGYGERIQFSVFRCRATQRQIERMQWELKKIMSLDDDLLLIGLCDSCVNHIRKRKDNKDWEQKISNYEII